LCCGLHCSNAAKFSPRDAAVNPSPARMALVLELSEPGWSETLFWLSILVVTSDHVLLFSGGVWFPDRWYGCFWWGFSSTSRRVRHVPPHRHFLCPSFFLARALTAYQTPGPLTTGPARPTGRAVRPSPFPERRGAGYSTDVSVTLLCHGTFGTHHLLSPSSGHLTVTSTSPRPLTLETLHPRAGGAPHKSWWCRFVRRRSSSLHCGVPVWFFCFARSFIWSCCCW